MNNLQIKTPLKYQLNNYKHVILIMYLCVYLITLLIFILHRLNFSVSGSNFELVSATTVFVVGLNSFKDHFKFFSANGVSRKSQFFSTVAALGILSAIFALIDTINNILFAHFTVNSTLFLQIYGSRFGFDISKNHIHTMPQIVLETFLWLVFFYFFLSIVGLFITTLYYRMNKGLKIAVSIVVLVLLNTLPALDLYLSGGKVSSFLVSAGNAAMGFSNGYNPYIGMCSMLIFAVIFAALDFLLARKAAIKK